MRPPTPPQTLPRHPALLYPPDCPCLSTATTSGGSKAPRLHQHNHPRGEMGSLCIPSPAQGLHVSHRAPEPWGSLLFALLQCKMAEPGREAAPRWKPQTQGPTKPQENFLPQGEGVSDLGRRNPASGFSDAQRHPGVPSCPGTAWCGQQGGRSPHGASRGGCGHGRSRQAAALGMVPRKLHLCRLLSDQHPTGATSPARPLPAAPAMLQRLLLQR